MEELTLARKLNVMQKIVPSLWANHNAEKMADLYSRVFGATVTREIRYPENPLEFQQDLAGKVLTLDMEIDGFRFNIINADDAFRPNPAMSFVVNFGSSIVDKAKDKLSETYHQLIDNGGRALMELDSYPFSEYYGWVEDQFGVSWQLMLTSATDGSRPLIMPALMFTRGNHTTEFTTMVLELFPGSERGSSVSVPGNNEQIMFSDAKIADQWFMISDGGEIHDFTFTCGNSLIVLAKDQEELDRLWNVLSADPEAEQCGWCRDRFGVSWQIIPENLEELMNKPDAFEKLMGMKKIQISEF